MNTGFFDIETTAIDDWTSLEGLKKIHCISIGTENNVITFSGDNVIDGVEMLSKFDLLIGHNIINFDIPAIKKLYPKFEHKVIRDTMVMSQSIYSDIITQDRHQDVIPKELQGRHSLKAWGYRLGLLKGDYSETTDWEVCTPEMIEYCEQDVRVTMKLYNDLCKHNPSDSMLLIEHKFASLMRDQEVRGWKFDVEGCKKLTAEIMGRKAKLEDTLQDVFPPKVIEMKAFFYNTPDGKEWNTKQQAVKAGYKAAQIEKGRRKTKEIPFNPASRDQIAERLKEKYQWQPKLYTPAGKPKIDEGVLKNIDAPEAKMLCDYLLCIKRLGQIAEGKEAWLNSEKNGFIHGRVLTNGTVSGRCSHRNPNVAQVPALGAEYGKECRALFQARDGFSLVGFDASSIELRTLAHYMWRYDKGEYAKEVIEGDVHTLNQKKAGLPTRNASKRFIYAFLYGAGDQLLGELVNGGQQEGKEVRAKFLKGLPALNNLIIDVKKASKKGTIKAIDNRNLTVRSEHVALNLLLQSCAAIIMKTTSCYLGYLLKNAGFVKNKDYAFVGNIHDEIQAEVLHGKEDEYGKLAQQAIREAGKFLDFRCQLDGEYHIGKDWSETH